MELILLIAAGLGAELLDASLGMLYGTILSPVLIIAGYDPLVVVPSILLTQAVAGVVAPVGHQRLRNADFSIDNAAIKRRGGESFITSLKRAIGQRFQGCACRLLPWYLGVCHCRLCGDEHPQGRAQHVLGVLVLAMGVVLVSRGTFRFSWKKVLGIGGVDRLQLGAVGRRVRPGGDGWPADLGQGKQERDRGDHTSGSTNLRCGIPCLPVEERNVDLEPHHFLGCRSCHRRDRWPADHGTLQVGEEGEDRAGSPGIDAGSVDARKHMACVGDCCVVRRSRCVGGSE